MLALQKRYRALRPQVATLSQLTHEAIPEPALAPIAEALGLAVHDDGRIQLYREEDAEIFQDFIAHQVTIDESRPIEAIRDRLPPGSEARRVAEAMAQASFRLVQVSEVLPDHGARVQDATTGERLLVADAALRKLPEPGLVFCAHFLSLDGLILHTGAPLEILPEALETIEAAGPGLGLSMPPAPDQETDFAALVIRCGLEALAGAHEAAPLTRRERREQGDRGTRRALTRAQPSLNGPCPCGSGKRYKACHGRSGRRR